MARVATVDTELKNQKIIFPFLIKRKNKMNHIVMGGKGTSISGTKLR